MSQQSVPPEAAKQDDAERQRLFEPGDVVAGRYRIERYIARGGMGEVYAAEDRDLGQPVALKAVRPEVAVHSQTLDRFRREINLSRKVTHRNVCRIYDVGNHHDARLGLSIRFLTMELLDGQTLTRHLRRKGPLTTDEALPILVQVASGLAAAHASGVVHRDFKTSNVLLTESRRGLRAVITDFGLSQTLGEDGQTPMDSDRLTGTGQLMGTLAYLAPEQLEGRPASAATDIYALGVVLFQTITGRLPFDGSSPLMAALKRLHEAPPDPADFVPDLEPLWRDVILRCLRRDPAERFASADLLLEALGVELLTESSTSITQPQIRRLVESGSTELPLPPHAKVVRHVPMWKATVGALAVGLAVALVAWLAPPSGGDHPSDPPAAGGADAASAQTAGGSAPGEGGTTATASLGVKITDPVILGRLADSGRDAVATTLHADLRAALERVPGASEAPEGAAAEAILGLDAFMEGDELVLTLQRLDAEGNLLWDGEERAPEGDPEARREALHLLVRRAFADSPEVPVTDER